LLLYKAISIVVANVLMHLKLRKLRTRIKVQEVSLKKQRIRNKTDIQTYDKLLCKDNLRHGNSKTALNSRLIKNGGVLSD